MTEEPYRKMSSNQEFHKTKFHKKKLWKGKGKVPRVPSSAKFKFA